MKKPTPPPAPEIHSFKFDITQIATEITDFVDRLGNGLSQEHERKAKQQIERILSQYEIISPAKQTTTSA